MNIDWLIENIGTGNFIVILRTCHINSNPHKSYGQCADKVSRAGLEIIVDYL